MSQNRFATMPTIDINRSKFMRNFTHKTSMNLGDLVPILVDEVLPGDSHKVDFGALIRMSNPIAPIMDDIQIDYYGFFVPNRLVWSHWKEFMGENNTSAGIYTGTEFKIPSVDLGGTTWNKLSVGDYMGLPSVVGTGTSVSTLPIRSYRLIYNEFFRDQNVEAPLAVNLTDVSDNTDDPWQAVQVAYKLSDYFTRALPYVQKGAPVTIPMGTTAPLKALNTIYTIPGENGLGQNPISLGGSALPAGSYYAGINTTINNNLRASPTGAISSTGVFNQTNIVADLSQATAATINQLRFAFQLQKLLERDCYGTRYWEILKAHFSVTAPDASLQRPQFLGHYKGFINIDQVIQTTGIDQATPGNNKLGQVAANSVTGHSSNLFNFSATEHGWMIVLAVARQSKHTYGQGINRMWSRSVRTDFYFPEFANLGAQKILAKELFAQGNPNDETIFGYQEAWAEYRYSVNVVSGDLKPSNANSLDYWTLAENFATLPTLTSSFLKETRSNLSRCLSTASTGPDFICDFAFKDVAIRPLPMYSIPGLIDHH